MYGVRFAFEFFYQALRNPHRTIQNAADFKRQHDRAIGVVADIAFAADCHEPI